LGIHILHGFSLRSLNLPRGTHILHGFSLRTSVIIEPAETQIPPNENAVQTERCTMQISREYEIRRMKAFLSKFLIKNVIKGVISKMRCTHPPI
jgi:hypothetical protein